MSIKEVVIFICWIKLKILFLKMVDIKHECIALQVLLEKWIEPPIYKNYANWKQLLFVVIKLK